MWQISAPIQPGNSGGPLINLKGEVIGINNAIDQRAQGIGFAIPINLVKKVLPQLRTKGTVARGYIGVLVSEMTPELAAKLGVNKDLRAPFVTNVYPDAPAEKAGLKAYDVILEFNGTAIHSSSELIMAVTAVEVGQSVPIKISRGGSEKTLTLVVTQRPGTQELAGKEKGKNKKKSKKAPTGPDTGMELEDLTADLAKELGMTKPTGVLVRSTAYGGPADKAGLIRGDVILEVDRKPLKDVDQFYSIVKEKKSYLLRVRRADPQGQEVFSVVILDLKGQ
jgi:serine protease Do